MMRTTRVGLLGVIAAGAFWVGTYYPPASLHHGALLDGGLTMATRVASLQTRVAAVLRENDNLRTELRVRSALSRHGRRIDPETVDRIMASILEAHNRYGLSTEVLQAVIRTESGFDINALSSAGAIGLMQVMPATGRQMASELNIPWTGKEMLYDPAINIQLGSEYLHRMFRRFGHADNALAAYNAGPARVRGLQDAGIIPTIYPGRVRRGVEYYSRQSE
ncbi:MAG: lytic transglycosylase domain-containing protein [Acidobacteriota bacterium]